MNPCDVFQRYLLSLDDALKMLMGDTCEDTDRLRTRGRRLYDIANVLTSLGLVQRVPLAKGFRYIGPEVEPIPSDEGMHYYVFKGVSLSL